MPRRHVTISTETVDALLGDVAAGRSLSAACRDRGIKRSTTADQFSEPTLAARLEAARAAGKGVRASRPRRRRASAPTGATQPDHGAAGRDPRLIWIMRERAALRRVFHASVNSDANAPPGEVLVQREVIAVHLDEAPPGSPSRCGCHLGYGRPPGRLSAP